MTVRPEVAAFRAALQDVLMDYGRAEWSCGHNHTKEDHPTGRCPRIDAALDEVWAALEAVPPAELDEDALDAAERAYWSDDGVSRSNLAAAIRAYHAVVRRASSTGGSGAAAAPGPAEG